ncbi:MAG TPA: gamma-glutamyltransferase [Gemmatimonadales bacterium]|nr:gamma-glutamyltransferase [Gemmatimonadales bacterium]
MPVRRLALPYSALALVLIAACSRGPAPTAAPAPARADLSAVPKTWPLFARVKPVEGTHGMVVSGSPIASDVGRDILERGGNAVDAAVAVGFALAVVHPEAGNIGGGGFMVIRLANGTATTLDYREVAPGAATPTMYIGPDGKLTDKSVTGALSVGVPGSVAGMAAAEARYGKLSLATVMAPAIKLARDGFVLDAFRSHSIGYAVDRLRLFAASREKFLVDGHAPPPGTRFVQPELAQTLQAIADSGPDAFYRGHIADQIVAEMQRDTGIITKADLAAYKPIWRDPITVTYRGYTVYSMPPSSSGGITMGEMLNILEGYDPLPTFDTPQQVHLWAEAMRRAFVDRNHYLGDPAFVTMPVATLLSKEYAAKRRATILPDRATPTADVHPGVPEPTHTTHYSIVDADGNAVSVTTTLNNSYGSAVTVAGAGFLLNDEMDDFTGAPGQPNMYGLVQGEANAIRPGKRMLSAMTPTIVLDPEKRLFMVVGTPGGPTIITTVAQVISDVIDQHMTLAQAVGAPRIHEQGLPDKVFYEHGGLSAATVQALQAMGYTMDERSGYSGDVAAIERTATGWVGVPDPRRGAGAAGY